MPNLTLNQLTVSGPTQDLGDFVAAAQAVRGESGEPPAVLDFNRHVPMPLELLEAGQPPLGELPAWLIWRREQWGTKWNADMPTLEGDPQAGSVRYAFMTAWRPPDIWLDRVSEEHPTLRLYLECVDESLLFSRRMVWEGGQFVLADDIDPHTLDWLELEPISED